VGVLTTITLFCRPNAAQRSSTVACQAKLADKYAVFDAVQGFCQPVCLHCRCAHKFQYNIPLFHLLVDLLIPNVDMPRMCGLEGIEHGQPGVLAVRMDEQRCSLWVSGLCANLRDPFDAEGCWREVNELGLSGRDRDDCLFPALSNDWVAG